MTSDEITLHLHDEARRLSLDDALASAAEKTLRAEFNASSDVFQRRLAICAQIAGASDPIWREALVRLRDDYETRTIGEMVAAITREFGRSPEDGWRAWLRAMADAVLAFRPRYTSGLCAPAFPFEPSRLRAVENIRRAVGRMAKSRWEECLDEVAELADLAAQELLPVATRARLIAMQGQIEMWRFSEMRRARALLDQANSLSPDDAWILSSIGDHQLESGERDHAEASYRRAIKIAPNDASGYVGLGDLCEKSGRRDEAESWYREAIARTGGDPTGYNRLLKLLARSGYRQNTAEISDLMAIGKAIDPEGEYDACLALSGVCADAGLPEEAQNWCERAESLEPGDARAYVSLAELSSARGNAEDAEKLAAKAVDLAPEYPGAFLALGRFLEDQGRWNDVLRLFETFPDRPARWKLYARATIARMCANLGDLGAAQSELLAVLQEEAVAGREQVYSRAAIETLAEDCYRKHDDVNSALRLFDQILASDASYRARYHNLVGNLYYYREEYPEAARHYRSAIEANPASADFHRYLGTALSAMDEFDEARREIEAAFARDGDGARRDEELGALENKEGNRAYERSDYREAIERYTQAVKLSPSKAVHYANLAQAWEQLKAPGERIANLGKAQQWYAEAQKLVDDPRRARRIERLERRREFARAYGEEALDRLPFVSPIAVTVAADLEPLIEGPTPQTLSEGVGGALRAMRDRVERELGLSAPGIRFRGDDGALPHGTYVVMLCEVPIVSGIVRVGHRFVVDPPGQWSGSGVKSESALDPVTGKPGRWIKEDDPGRLGVSDHESPTAIEFLLRHLEAFVRHFAAELVGYQEVVNLLETEAESVREPIARSDTGVSTLTNVCKALLAENVPIRPFGEVCASFNAMRGQDMAPRVMVERLRDQPGFLERLPGREGRRKHVRCSEGFEARIRSSLYGDAADRVVLAIEPSHCQDALAAVRGAVAARNSVLVVGDPTLRPFVHSLVTLEFPDLTVLSIAETRKGAEYAIPRVDLDVAPLPGATAMAAPAGRRIAERPDPAPSSADLPRIEVVVAPGFGAIRSPADDSSLSEAMTAIRDTFFFDLGVAVPPIEVREDESLAAAEFRIQISGTEPASFTGLGPDECLVNEDIEGVRLLGLDGREELNPDDATASTVVTGAAEHLQTCRGVGLTARGPVGYLTLQLSSQIRRAAPILQNDVVTRYMLDALADSFPDLVERSLNRFGLPKLGQMLRHLLAEEISIRDLRNILEALLGLYGTTDVDLVRFMVFESPAEPLCPDPGKRLVSELPASQLADHVRTRMKRAVSYKYSRGSGTLVAYLLAPAIEEWLREAASAKPDVRATERFIAAVRNVLPERPASTTCLLTNFDIRGTAWRLLRDAFPRLSVLCYQELAPELNIQPIARIEWP